MKRRELLRALGVAGVAGLAGCGKNRDEWSAREGPPKSDDYPTASESGNVTLNLTATASPGDGFTFVATDYGETDDGYLSVTSTVTNETEEPQAAVLVFKVVVDETTYAERETVRLDPGERETYEFVFDIKRSEYLEADSKRIAPHWEPIEE